jgi:hypothetical protein
MPPVLLGFIDEVPPILLLGAEGESKPSEMRERTDCRMRWPSAAAVELAPWSERPPGPRLALLPPAGERDRPSDTRDRMDEPRSLWLLEEGREETGENMALLLEKGRGIQDIGP